MKTTTFDTAATATHRFQTAEQAAIEERKEKGGPMAEKFPARTKITDEFRKEHGGIVQRPSLPPPPHTALAVAPEVSSHHQPPTGTLHALPYFGGRVGGGVPNRLRDEDLWHLPHRHEVKASLDDLRRHYADWKKHNAGQTEPSDGQMRLGEILGDHKLGQEEVCLRLILILFQTSPGFLDDLLAGDLGRHDSSCDHGGKNGPHGADGGHRSSGDSRMAGDVGGVGDAPSPAPAPAPAPAPPAAPAADPLQQMMGMLGPVAQIVGPVAQIAGAVLMSPLGPMIVGGACLAIPGLEPLAAAAPIIAPIAGTLLSIGGGMATQFGKQQQAQQQAGAPLPGAPVAAPVGAPVGAPVAGAPIPGAPVGPGPGGLPVDLSAIGSMVGSLLPLILAVFGGMSGGVGGMPGAPVPSAPIALPNAAVPNAVNTPIAV